MDQVLREFVQQLLLNAIPIVVPLILAWIIKIEVEIWGKIKSWRPELAYLIEEVAQFAVNAAEQVGLSSSLKDFTDSKLNYAKTL